MKITTIRPQTARPNRFSVYIDGRYAFGMSDAALLESKIVPGQEIDERTLRALRDLAAKDTQYGNVLRYAALRPRSEWELRQYLARKRVAPADAENSLRRLAAAGLADDAAFAKAWVDNRRLLKPVSRRRLQMELRQKHVADSVIDVVLAEDETHDTAVLRDIIRRKARRYPDRTKLLAYLARQGFRYDDIRAEMDNFFSGSGESDY